jgi:hypothetical protein
VTWAKFCDGFLDHPKVLRAGEDAANLFMRGCIWCNKHLTDGAIPREALRALTQRRDAPALAAKLVTVRLWEETPDGWQVHDWSDHNPTRESVEKAREKTREKVANWRDKRGNTAAKASCNHGCNPVTCKVCNRVSNPAPDPTRPDLLDDDDGAAVAADSRKVAAPERPIDPRVERNAFEVLAEASRGAVSPLAHLDDMMAFNDLVLAVGIDHDELRAFGEWLTGRDAMKRLWPSSKARASGQTITAGWFTRSKSRVFLEGVQRWREITAGARIAEALATDDAQHEAPVEPPPARVIATDVAHLKNFFRRKA